MASPQTENGFTRIANEIVDAMARTRLSGRQSQILWVIFRRTYGYQKKDAAISFDLFTEMTGIKRWHVANELKVLERRRIIIVRRHATGNAYAFQKNYEAWDTNGSITENGNGSITDFGTHERKKERERNKVATDFLPSAEQQAAILFAGRQANGNGYGEAERKIAASGWSIGNHDLHTAVVYFVAATEMPVPRVKGTRRDWLAALSEHVEEYGADALKDLYPLAVQKLRDGMIRAGRPGALSKTLPVAAHMLAHPDKPKGYEL